MLIENVYRSIVYLNFNYGSPKGRIFIAVNRHVFTKRLKVLEDGVLKIRKKLVYILQKCYRKEIVYLN